MKAKYLLLIFLFISCNKIKEVTEYQPQELSFKLSGDVSILKKGDEVSVKSEGKVYRYLVSDEFVITASSDKDKLYINKQDKKIKVEISYPYSEDGVLKADVKAEQSPDDTYRIGLIGEIESERLYKQYTVNMKSVVLGTILNIEIPSNLIADKELSIKELAIQGVKYKFNKALSLNENKFVRLAVKPFEVESSGTTITFVTSENEIYEQKLFIGSKQSFLLGEEYYAYIKSINEFKPCTFPVVFPLGKNPKARTGFYNYGDDQLDWQVQGTWYCYTQKDVYAQFVKVSEPVDGIYYKREYANSGEVGSIGLKGIWTGDYFEFVFPIGRIAAGSKVSFKAPFYGRRQPIFWTVEYLDGGEWKSNTETITSWDGATSLEASFATKYGGVVVDYSFTLENEIVNDYLKVRIICTDGRYQAASNGVSMLNTPYISSNQYAAPFYFYCANSGVNAFTWDIE